MTDFYNRGCNNCISYVYIGGGGTPMPVRNEKCCCSMKMEPVLGKEEEYKRVIENIKFNLNKVKSRCAKNYGDTTIEWIIDIIDHLAEKKRKNGID